MLERVLHFATRHRWGVTLFWTLATVASAVFLPSLGSVVRNDTTAFLPRDAPSVEAAALAAPFLAPNGPTGVLVVSRTDGELTTADEATVERLEQRVRAAPLVSSVTDSAVSADGHAMLANIRFAPRTAGGGRSARSAVVSVRAAFAAGTSIIGCDAANGTFVQLYSDDRGVCRIYSMKLDGGEWVLQRDGDPFPQRFVGTINADARTISGRWEKAEDGGDFAIDFFLTYRKIA